MGGDPAARGYRVPAPDADSLIDWPADFGTRFTLFVDTEEEFDWRAPLSRDSRSVTAIAAMPAAHARFAGRGVAAGEGLRVLNVAFHSPSVEPGHTPYVRDAADLAAFWRWWDAVLDLLDRLGIRNASLAELLDAAG
jgi:hypothetical protein